jgi:phenylacetate-coenzyme A ligase PaaK-like adenylate-forming protein
MNMAFGCTHQRLHLNDDWVILEPIDANGHPVAPGQASTSVLVTNLANRVQPLIRYDLSDSVTIDADPCPCGNSRPTLRVGGRRDDILHFDRAPAGSRACGHSRVSILPLAIETVIEEEAGIHRFQLTQTAPDALCLRLDNRHPGERAAALRRVCDAMARLLAAQGARAVRITLDDGPPEANPVSGKLRQVRSACR